MRLKYQKPRVFNVIKNYIASNNAAPTIREIADRIDFRSPAGVHRILVALEKDGLIKRTREWRGIEIVGREQKNAA